MNKEDLVEQTRLAFEFIQKLYLEVSYLIKELEGLLYEEEERFIIGRPSGYSVNTRSSTGLEPTGVSLWPMRKMAVMFVSEELTKLSRGQTVTKFTDDPKVIYLRIVLDNPKLDEPILYVGVLNNFEGRRFEKVEQVIGHIEYVESRIFTGSDLIDYEDGYVKFQGRIFTLNLYDVNSSEEISKLLIEPVLRMYRAM